MNITASSSGYTSTTFTETATAAPILLLTPTAGNNQRERTGTTLPTALTVLATMNGNDLGATVTFNDGGAGGTFGTPTGLTGTNGTVSTTYTLPPAATTVTITATASGFSSATFTETATAPVETLTATSGNNQTGTIGTPLPTPLVVTATMNGSNASGVTVTFSDGGAGGSFGTPSGVTGSNGQVSTTYTPGSSGTITITASATGYTSATFTETVTNTSGKVLTATSGNNQSGPTSTKLPLPLTATATNNGTPVKGLKVTWTDNGAGGTFSMPTGATNANGVVSTSYTLPGTAKTVTITASATGYTSATFTETATANTVTSIALVSGGKQTGTVGTTLANPIVWKAKNASGQAVAGASISFTDGGVGGSFSPNPAITNSTGQASTNYTLPTVPKATIAITASDGSVTAATAEKSVVGPPVNLTIASGNNQSGMPSKALPKPLVVLVTDQYKNPISGVTVTFTDNGGGGTFSTTTPVTGTNGQASVTYTCGTKAQTVTISATTSTLGPLNFTETVK